MTFIVLNTEIWGILVIPRNSSGNERRLCRGDLSPLRDRGIETYRL